MNKLFTLSNATLSFILSAAMNGFAQTAGDFQTKSATGNWSDFNAWNMYNGSTWIAASAGQIPTSITAVYVQSGHTISVDNTSAACNDLNVNGATTSKVAFLATGILNVKGNMNLFSTAHNCFGSWTAGGKIVFSGAGAQGFTNLSVSAEFVDIEINKLSGTLTTSSNFRFGSFTLTAGNFTVGSGDEIQGSSGGASININGGVWTQILSTTKIYSIPVAAPQPLGPITINNGLMILATSNSSTGFLFSTLTVINGGTLTVNNFAGNLTIATSITVDAASTFNTALSSTPLPPLMIFDGMVNYNHTGGQRVSAANYSYLKLSGTGLKTLEAGATIIQANGTLEMSGVAISPTLALGAGTLNVSSTGTNLIYSSTGLQAATGAEWDINFQNVTIDNMSGVSMAGLARTIAGSLNLLNGILNIGAGGALTLDGAALNRINGYLDGTSTSDLGIIGATGGTVILPLAGNINLRNVDISGTRGMAMDGSNNIALYGLLNVGSTASYDNGGESQLTQGAGGSIVISGNFINRDRDNFTGANGAIPGIIPSLTAGCTIEYALAGDQIVTARSDYQNITFSGSGIKTLANTFAPLLTVYITGSAVVYAGNNFGDNGTAPFTNFNMDGGRLIVTTTGTQPCMTGTYTLAGGIVEFAGSQLTAQTIRSKSYENIEVTGNNVGNSNGNITLNTNGTFTVKTAGIFEINDNCITGSAGTPKVIIESGAIFRTGNNEGFNGYNATLTNNSSVHQNITVINLNAGSTVEYMRNGNQPITNANSLIYCNLLISGTGDKTAPPGILTIHGNLIKSGSSTFIHNGGTVLLNGPAPQSFAGLTYNVLILSNDIKTTAGNGTIIDSIKVSTGTVLSVSASDTITLHSDAFKTGRMAELEGSINYNTTGKFVVERYIPPKRAWRFLSIATNTSQTIKQAWQEGALATASNPAPGFGTQITSDRASWAADGFDLYSVNGPSMKTYNPGTDDYTGIASTNSGLLPGQGGYMTFIRGDRTANSFVSPVTSTVLRTTGSLYTGAQVPIGVIAGQITPYNNPYASPVDLRKLSQSPGIFFYVWDPNRGGPYGLGAFQTLLWNGATGNYDVVPGGSTSYPGNIDNFIESGQAFLVSGGSTSLALTEDKKGDGSGAIVFAPNPPLKEEFQTNLYAVNADGSTYLADGTLSVFDDNYSDEVDGMDAKKLSNFGENFSIRRANTFLVIERRQSLNHLDTVFLHLAGMKFRQYQFHFDGHNLTAGMDAFLEDNYLNIRSPLNLGGSTVVNFNIDNVAGSYAADRFRIVFAPSAVLPVTFKWVKAYKVNKTINVEWKVEDETNIKQYVVEKSTNGTKFATLALKAATANGGHSFVYLIEDTRPVEGYNYYRIKSLDLDGKTEYSNLVKVLVGTTKRDITLYSNPVTDGIFKLQFNNQAAGKYDIRLINKLGQVIFTRQINHIEGTSVEIIKWDRSLQHDIYQLRVTKSDGSVKDINVLY